MVTVIGVLLIIMGIFLVISVLMQSSKNHRVSGSIAGGAETFFGKQKGKTLDSLFNKLTTVVTIIFVILVLALCFILPTVDEVNHDMMVENAINYYKTEFGVNITEADLVFDEEGIPALADPSKILPVIESEVEEEAPVVEEETPVAEEEAPATEEEAPATEEEAPATEEEAPVAEEEAPATEEEAPVAEEEAPVAEEEAPVVEEEATVEE